MPWYRLSTKIIIISSRSYGNGEPRNVILIFVQIAHLALRTFKLPGLIQRGIGPPGGICGTSGLPFAMVPFFYQSNIYIKMKLWEWRSQKCNPYLSAKSPPRSADLQSTRFHAAPYRAASRNLHYFRATVRHGTVFAPKQ